MSLSSLISIQTSYSPLLSLPAELRISILAYVCIYSDPVVIPCNPSHPNESKWLAYIRKTSRLQASPAGILLACKQLYREAWSVFWGSNSFAFTFDTWKFNPTWNALPLTHLQQIKSISFVVRVAVPKTTRSDIGQAIAKDTFGPVWRSLYKFERLREIEIWVRAPTKRRICQTVREEDWGRCRAGSTVEGRWQIASWVLWPVQRECGLPSGLARLRLVKDNQCAFNNQLGGETTRFTWWTDEAT
ncbi:hypothetical protein MMC20_000591 [Loxospora ochrophaea]|nr:hypothetical protein [Loxospora ochrophaea]